MTPSGFLSHSLPFVLLLATAVAQEPWQCPDNGSSATIVSNNGSGDQSFVFTNSALVADDQSLRIIVFKPGDGGGNPEVIVDEIEFSSGTNPLVTIGPGMRIRIEDPSDADSKSGQGTYTKV